MSALYPDVPIASGIPPVLRQPGLVIASPVVLLGDLLDALSAFGPPQWGIYTQDGTRAIIADSVIGVDLRRDWRIPTHPVEQGGFASYNKVATPFDVRVILSAADSDTNRTALLAQVDAACVSLDLFMVITPEFVYPSANLVSYSYRRTADRGVRLLVVEVGIEEVRITAPTQFTQGQIPADAAKDPAAASPVNGGTVTTSVPSVPVMAAANAARASNVRAGEAPGGF